MHDIPVDPVPPPLQVLSLARNTVVHQPHMFPGVHAQNGMHIDGPRCQAFLVWRVSAHRTGVLVTKRGIARVGSHVDGLSPGVRRRVRRTGVIRAEDVHQSFPLQILSQPHETGAEHGVGRGQKVELQRFNRGARVIDVFLEIGGNLCLNGRLVRSVWTEWEECRWRESLTRQLKKKWLL